MSDLGSPIMYRMKLYIILLSSQYNNYHACMLVIIMHTCLFVETVLGNDLTDTVEFESSLHMPNMNNDQLKALVRHI